MKLRLPLFLLSFILSIPAAMPAAAAIGAGVSYDVGKGSEPYSKNKEAHNIPGQAGADTLYCWAASASNMIQYWQDTYKDKLKPETPNGFNLKDGQPKYDQPDGTRYLNVYEYILDHSLTDDGGYQSDAINWYYRPGTSVETLQNNTSSFMKDGVGAPDVTTHDYSMGFEEFDNDSAAAYDDLTSTLGAVYSTAGQSVGLWIWQQDPEDINRDDWDDLNSRSHAVTCWGYGTNADGQIDSLYLSDSDDMEFGVFKVNFSIDKAAPLYEGDSGMDAFLLQTDDQIDGYAGFVVSIVRLYAITPEAESGYSQYAKTATPLPTLDSKQGETELEVLSVNTVVQGAVERTGAGVKVGVGVQEGAPDIVMLVSEPTQGQYSSLTLQGDFENVGGTGLEVTHGSLASVSNLNVSGYERGVEAQGKVYLYGDTVEVSGNTLLDDRDGAGIYNANYVEIKDSASVQISHNFAMERGAGIYNEDVVSISGNGEVVFDGNFANSGGGHDIYNAAGARLNIADNGSVLFSGTHYTMSAVENDGDMYVKSGQDQVASVEFRDSALDSSEGTTYVGSDINGKTSATTVVFTDTEEGPARLEITGGENGLAAEIKKLTVNAHEIAGVGTNASSLKNAQIRTNNPLAISKLTMNTTDSIVSTSLGDVALDTVVFDLTALTGADIVDRKVDLTQMLTGNYTFSEVHFLMSDEISEEELKNLTFDLSKAYTAAEKAQIKEQIKLYSKGQAIVTDNVTFMFAENRVPEPTTGTLSLLALAALAARRRRKG